MTLRGRRRRPIAATVLIDADHLRAETDARGVTGRDLATEAGISEGTIYNALRQQPILVRNAKLIAGALQRLEVDEVLARLVFDRGVPPVTLARPQPGRRRRRRRARAHGQGPKTVDH